MKSIWPVILSALALVGCILPPKKDSPETNPTAIPTSVPSVRPTLPPAITPYPIPTPDTTEFEIIELPKAVFAGKPFYIFATAKEHDSVNVLVDRYQVGKMFWDANKKQKYLRVIVNSPGQRVIHFKVNGELVYSSDLLVGEVGN